MPKLKTRRGANKRFRFTATGRVKRKRAYLRHILSSKGQGQKRHLRRGAILAKVDERGIRRLLPYG